MIKKIVLTEDDADDILFFNIALKEIGYEFEPTVATNGVELINLLNNSNELPEVIFLDLNMTPVNGIECLQKIRKNSKLRDTKVVILSTSNNPTDIQLCQTMGANLFVTKPADYNKLAVTLKTLLVDGYLNHLPPNSNNFVYNTI